MIFNRQVVTNTNQTNSIDIINRLKKNEAKLFHKVADDATLITFLRNREACKRNLEAIDNLYKVDGRSFVEDVLVQFNGSNAYEKKPLSQLACTYGNLYLPVINYKDGTVKTRKYGAIYFTSDHITDDLTRYQDFDIYKAEDVRVNVLLEIENNKILLFREEGDKIDMTPIADEDKNRWEKLMSYPVYGLQIANRAKDEGILYDVVDDFANQHVLNNLKAFGVEIRPVKQNPIVKKIEKVFKKQNQTSIKGYEPNKVNDSEQQGYNVKVKLVSPDVLDDGKVVEKYKKRDNREYYVRKPNKKSSDEKNM